MPTVKVKFLKAWRGNKAGRECEISKSASILSAQRLYDDGILEFVDNKSLECTSPAARLKQSKTVTKAKAKAKKAKKPKPEVAEPIPEVTPEVTPEPEPKRCEPDTGSSLFKSS